MFFLAVNIIKKNCVIGKQGFSLFPFFVLGIVPIFANDNYTLTSFFRGQPGGGGEELPGRHARISSKMVVYLPVKYDMIN